MSNDITNSNNKLSVMVIAIASLLLIGMGMNSAVYATTDWWEQITSFEAESTGQSLECVIVVVGCDGTGSVGSSGDAIIRSNNGNNNNNNTSGGANNNEPGTLEVTKTVQCDSNGGLPNNEAVCIYALVTSDNRLTADTFQFTVTGNDPNPSSFQASELITEVSIEPGIYSVSESVPTNKIDSLLNELRATEIIISTAVTGDCTANYDIDDRFIDASGTMTTGDEQTCDIINSIMINGGRVPR